MSFQISESKQKFLAKHDWIVKETPYGYLVKNQNTGCKISGLFVEKFVDELLEELREEEEKEIEYSEEEVLKEGGYTILCESPYELKDKNGNMITGQCAKWLTQELVIQYKNERL